MMRKIISLALSAMLLFVMVAACAGGGTGGSGDSGEIKIALVGHSPESIIDDGSFNQGAWAGISKFLDQHGLSRDTNARWFQAHSADTDARIDVLSDAVENWGAQILILPGFDWSPALYEAQALYPDAMFVILDSVPATPDFSDVRIDPNVAAVAYAEHESGFLAGYALVKDGYRDLGFIGGRAVPPVVRFGHGYILGAEYAAEELGLSAGDITINFHYWGAFIPSPEATTFAASWYAAGTEVIFAAAGGVGFSVMSAAEGASTFVVGVDVDQAGDSPTIITSAMKMLDVSVFDILNDWNSGSFKGGQELLFNAANNGIGLPMATSKFNSFSQADYDAIFGKIASGAVSVSDTLDMADITTSLVTVNEIS